MLNSKKKKDHFDQQHCYKKSENAIPKNIQNEKGGFIHAFSPIDVFESVFQFLRVLDQLLSLFERRQRT
ncbi:MAG: hypothetical protein C5B45_06760 [Chlamydiae bacterium]|nr:MAG: hypothetical protein C5B45_06760 [Chlamydiota bacterium]